jgi:hypothetical protein
MRVGVDRRPNHGGAKAAIRAAPQKDMSLMKTTLAAIAILLGAIGAANAQSDMSCADLLKANAQIDAATKAEMAKDATAAAMDKKVNDYCTKNPAAKASEAMEKALAD